MKASVWSVVWRANIDKDIEDVFTSCRSCVAHQSLPLIAPLHSWPWDNHPMQHIHIDFASIEQFQILYRRKFWRSKTLTNLTILY